MLKIRDFIVIFALCMTLLLFFLAFTPYTYSSYFSMSEREIITKIEKQDLGISNRSIAIINSSNEDIRNVITSTLGWMQINHVVYDTIAEMDNEETLVITSSIINADDISMIKDFLSTGGNVIFAAKLDFVLGLDFANDELFELLGIKTQTPDYEVAGFTIYDGIILSGLTHVPEYSFVSNGLELHGHAKIFANGYSPALAAEIEEDPVRAEYPDITPLIWRTIYENGQVFAINAPFLSETSGAGVLAGVLALCYDDLLYPVVGTKTVALENFPYIRDIYYPVNARTTFAYTRDIIWPGLLSTAKNMDLTYTCYTNGDFYQSTEAEISLQFILEELSHLNYGELAYGSAGLGRYEADMQYLNEHFYGIKINSLINPTGIYGTNITAVSNTDKFEGFTWQNDKAVTLPVTGSGNDVNESTFAFESYITAFGFAMHHIDMEPVFLEENTANLYMRDVSAKLYDLFQRRDYLEAASALIASQRVKDYLNLNMAVTYQENGIDAVLNGHRDAVKFILRTTKDINERRSSGITIQKIYEGVYLLTVESESFSIVLE
ncbi:MAG: DUF2194 domain-containing protein [Lachnospiraceae bacterium]|nr:DUF2194 domain-containing protein [Lachnospiraceae bacterium]